MIKVYGEHFEDSPFALWVLVAVWPWAPAKIFAPRERNVHTIKGTDQLFGFPELFEYLNDGRLGASFPGHFLMAGPIGKIHSVGRCQ